MIIVLGFSLDGGSFDNLTPFFSERPMSSLVGPLGLAMVAVLWTFDGWIFVSYVAGEIVNPEKNLSRSMLLGVVIVTILYMMINGVYLLGASPYEMVDNQGSGIQTIGFFVAERLFGKSIGFTANVLIIIILFLTIG